MDHFERVEVISLAELRSWLKGNHERSEAVWLVTHKKSQGELHVPYSDVVDELLCWGWVDSTPRKLDDQRSMLLIANRKRKSRWSKVNKDKVARLLSEGRMQPAGLAKVELAKSSGTWDALNEVDLLVEPDDLAASLENVGNAMANWQAFPPSTRRGILEWILSAKSPETRARRIAQTASQAAENIRANQPRQLKGTKSAVE
ncbi:MAG: YdeI/OmpD-associated family protein [Armatimonadota bacterium]